MKSPTNSKNLATYQMNIYYHYNSYTFYYINYVYPHRLLCSHSHLMLNILVGHNGY